MVRRASIVIPAHDEGERIARTLGPLRAGLQSGEFEVVVVCNGCQDDTADRARTVPGVVVEELDQASKMAALRAGDEIAQAWPRIYLDADVQLGVEDARSLVEALESGSALVAGLPGRMDLAQAPLLVRLFFEFRQRLPVMQQGFIGAGVYALSEEGRERFGQWPDVRGDDQFIFRLYGSHERATVEAFTEVVPPTSLQALVRRGVRVRRGNRQLNVGSERLPPLPPPEAGFRTAVAESLRSPRGVASLFVFVALSLIIRVSDRLGNRDDWAS